MRLVAQNVAMIADTFESPEKIEDWTDRDKQQVEQEIQSIIDNKEKRLKEHKENKVETARKNKQPLQETQPLNRGSETYAEAVKKHIHQKLNPNKSDPTGSKKRPEERDQRRYYETARRDRERGYRRYQQQSRDYDQYEGGKHPSQRR